MADGADRLAGFAEGPHEIHRCRSRAQFVGIHQSAGQDARVEFFGLRVRERDVHVEEIAFVGVAHALDFFLRRRDDAHRGPGFFQRLQRAFEFGLFKAVRGENGDTFVEERMVHIDGIGDR